jgi:carbamoyltransferase
MPRWTLGLGGSDHDFSAALMCDGDIKVAIEQERLTRRKHGTTHWFESPVDAAIDYCLRAEGISMSDVSAVVAADTIPSRVRHDLKDRALHLYPHHLCHAASAYMMLPAGAKAGILVYDGFGSVCGRGDDDLHCRRETFSFFVFRPDGHECFGTNAGTATLEGDDFPTVVTDSFGLLYELVTGVLGYDPMDAGKTMGLASFGQPRHADLLRSFITFSNDPSDFFRCRLDDVAIPQALDRLLRSGSSLFSAKADLAASIQAVMDDTAMRAASFFRNRDIDHFCISGGCALNTVSNSFVVSNSSMDVPISIPPHCGDAGLGFGALWLDEFGMRGRAPSMTFRGQKIGPCIARPGRLYDAEARADAVNSYYPRLSLDASVRGPSDVARILVEGDVVGLFNGRSEIGPRALGGRSIIADPSPVSVRERINRTAKGREPFRPLAPMVLATNYDRYFEDPRQADPYMLKVARVRDACRRDAPAVVHVDGTARVQIVRPDDEPFLGSLLLEFEKLTGRGVLLNTSFNRRGEPIVETPTDAVDAFVGLSLDGLYLDGDFYRLADSLSR